jgi:para-nitrobenzyl esterase
MTKMSDILSTASGDIQGILRPDFTTEYLGIRYATAERFQPPVDSESWNGIFVADTFGSLAPQIPGMLEQMLGLDSSAMNEDCHFLNVFAPTSATTEGKLPVLFWIHGGAFLNGAGSLAWYHGSRLAHRGAVVVTINYRLGALGFIDKNNYGTLDMISALRWTQRNISSYGGDPHNVTIFGESAGGSAVISLMACNDAAPLFKKVWSMSPSIGQLRSAPRAEEITSRFLKAAGVQAIDKARTLELSAILDAQTTVIAIPSDSYDIFAPAGNGESMPSDIMKAAVSSGKPLVIGTNRDENKLFSAFDQTQAGLTLSDWSSFLRKRFPNNFETAQQTYEKYRPGETAAQLISAVNTDLAFRRRAQLFSEQRDTAQTPTWMYWFTWTTPAFGGLLGSCHALDIPFAFDNLDAPGTELLTGDGPERTSIASRFADEIIHFATHGHPTWEQFNTATRPTFRIDADSTLENDPEAEIRSLYP